MKTCRGCVSISEMRWGWCRCFQTSARCVVQRQTFAFALLCLSLSLLLKTGHTLHSTSLCDSLAGRISPLNVLPNLLCRLSISIISFVRPPCIILGTYSWENEVQRFVRSLCDRRTEVFVVDTESTTCTALTGLCLHLYENSAVDPGWQLHVHAQSRWPSMSKSNLRSFWDHKIKVSSTCL